MKRVLFCILTLVALNAAIQLNGCDGSPEKDDFFPDDEFLKSLQSCCDEAEAYSKVLDGQLQPYTNIKIPSPLRPPLRVGQTANLETNFILDLIDDKKVKEEALVVIAKQEKIEKENENKKKALERINNYVSSLKSFEPISAAHGRIPLAEISPNLQQSPASQFKPPKPSVPVFAAPFISHRGKPPRRSVKAKRRYLSAAAAAAKGNG